MDKIKATKIASRIGKIIAILFIITGIFFQHLSLSLIGIFIFLMAGMEYKSLRINELIKSTTAGNIMRTKFTMVSLDDSYEKLIQLYQKANEKNFLVFNASHDVVGSVPNLYIRDVLEKGNQECPVKDLMNPNVAVFPAHTSLEFLMMAMKDKGLAIVGIEEEAIITGVIDRDMIQDFIILKSS